MMTMFDGTLPFNGSIGGGIMGKAKNISNKLRWVTLVATIYAGLLFNRALQSLHLGVSFMEVAVARHEKIELPYIV